MGLVLENCGFSIAKVATIKLQDHKITMENFYNIWIPTADTVNINSSITIVLYAAIKIHEGKLLHNEVFLSDHREITKLKFF